MKYWIVAYLLDKWTAIRWANIFYYFILALNVLISVWEAIEEGMDLNHIKIAYQFQLWI